MSRRKGTRRERGDRVQDADGVPARQRAKGAANPDPAPRRRAGSELAAYIERFPDPGAASLAFSVACIALGNAYLFWLVWIQRLSLAGLVLLVLVEGVLLSLMEAVQRWRLPPEHRWSLEHERVGQPGSLVAWIAFVVGIGGAYLLWAMILKQTDALVAFATGLQAWRDAGIDVAAGITLAFAVIAFVADQRHYRTHGPPYVSSLATSAMTRRITFTYGALVIALPLFGSFALVLQAIKRIAGDRDDRRTNALGGLVVIGTFFGLFFGLAAAVKSGARGWAAVYLLGKVVTECLFAAMPLLARKAQQRRDPVADG